MFQESNKQINLLIIDDDPIARALLISHLNDTYTCDTANSAEQALIKLRQREYAIILSDVSLPDMNGFEMMPHLSFESPDSIVIFMTAKHSSVDDVIAALRTGAFDYLLKPFDLVQVAASVGKAVEHYQLKEFKRQYNDHLEDLVSQRTIELDKTLEELEETYRGTLKALAQALETRDHETHGHSERVVTFSLRIGYELGLNRKQLRDLEFGALLHDVGKIGVPDAILRKPAKLTDEEWQKMRLHPALGQEILRDVSFLEGAAKVVSQHHEKWNGAGYPFALQGEEIDINARIFAVADAFDAIISNRVYSRGRSFEDAVIEITKCSGGHFDPQVVEAFLKVPREDWELLNESSLIGRTENGALKTLMTELSSDIPSILVH